MAAWTTQVIDEEGGEVASEPRRETVGREILCLQKDLDDELSRGSEGLAELMEVLQRVSQYDAAVAGQILGGKNDASFRHERKLEPTEDGMTITEKMIVQGVGGHEQPAEAAGRKDNAARWVIAGSVATLVLLVVVFGLAYWIATWLRYFFG